MKLAVLFLFFLATQLSAIAQKATAYKTEEKSEGKVAQQIEQFSADAESLNRVYIFKDSPEYYDRFNSFYAATLQQLKSLSFNTLTVSDQADYLLFKRNLLKANDDLETAQKVYEQLAPALPFAQQVIELQQTRRRGAALNPEATATLVNNIKKSIITAQADARKKEFESLAMAQKTAGIVDELRRGLQNTFDFYNTYDPLFSWWVKKPHEEADTALAQYVGYLKTAPAAKAVAYKDDGSGIRGNPVGAAELKRLLEFEMIPYTAEELVTIANREFAWCDAEMKKASAALGFGADWKAALEKIKQNYVAPGKQPELANKLAEEAILFLEKNNLVTIPPLAKEAWRMTMLSEAQQRFAPFFLGGESILVAYPTDKMDHDTKLMSLKSNNYAFSHAVVFHELIPGHNLQFFMSRRYKQYRRQHFSTPFSVEGWALYWEMLLWDKNFHDTPEKKIGALFWRMHRCARILFSLNYHLGKWTPQQCIDFLVDRVGHERFSATSEVRRSFEGNYGPLYQLAYMMGGLQLRALHKEVVGGGKLTDKEFHDAFLKENTLPIEMFRAIITNTKLTEGHKTSWRFANELK